MKILNSAELKAVAKDIFDRYPKAQKVAVTSDGEAFIIDQSDLPAKNHARRNRSGKELSITPFEREDVSDKAEKTANDLIVDIAAAETVEAVEAIKATEASGKNRKSVIAAAENRILELNPKA